MVKCDVLLLAASILLVMTAAITPPSGTARQAIGAASVRAAADGDSTVPIHRIIVLIEPVKDLSDPLVTALHNKTLTQKYELKRKRSLPRPKLPGDSAPAPTVTKKLLPGQTTDPAESINPEQLTALEELYLTDAFTDLLSARYRISVVDAKEVDSAIKDLNLSRIQAAGPDGALRLCSRLECDAVVLIGAPELTMRDGTARDLIMRTRVRVAALRLPHGSFSPTHVPKELPVRMGAANTNAQVEYTVAGVAFANRTFLSAGYASNYPALAEQAATQAAAIALHMLSTGEQAPLMKAGTRIAIAPAYGPNRADVLVLASSGRHTEIGAVRQLPPDVTSLFNPNLLPILGNDIINPTTVGSAIPVSSITSAGLWLDNYKPDTMAIQTLGGKLHVQYMLVAHVTDLEIATAPSGDAAGLLSKSVKDSLQPKDARPWEREAHAEACGALIRIQDGAVLWTDRGDTTVNSQVKVATADRATANRLIAIDAEKYALIDLTRHFSAFRSQFEQ